MGDWRDNLNDFMSEDSDEASSEQRSELDIFIQDTAMDAFREVESQLVQHGRDITIRNSGTSAMINVRFKGVEEMVYRLQIRRLPDRELPYAEIRYRERKGLRYVTVERMLRSGGKPDYLISDISSDEISQHIIEHYIKHGKSE